MRIILCVFVELIVVIEACAWCMLLLQVANERKDDVQSRHDLNRTHHNTWSTHINLNLQYILI